VADLLKFKVILFRSHDDEVPSEVEVWAYTEEQAKNDAELEHFPGLVSRVYLQD
jgi:hypothetical protein